MKKGFGAFKPSIADLIWPPYCFGCGELIRLTPEQYKSRYSLALCPKCADKFDVERRSLCPRCDKEHIKCHCRPVNMPGNLSGCIHVSRYTAWDSVTDGMVLGAKGTNNKFLYELLSNSAVKAIKSRVPDYRNAVVTAIPRDVSAIRKTGVDQSKLAASMAAKKLGLCYVDALVRLPAKEQKGLSAKDRLANAYSAYKANKKALPTVAGKSVILYDDVLTTGATVSAGSEILFKMGASRVFVLAFAMRYNDKLVDMRRSDILDEFRDYDASDELGK